MKKGIEDFQRFFDENDLEHLEERDAMNFKSIAKDRILPDIESFTPPFIYGIYGDWGSGKTFMMRLLEKYLNEKKQYKTVWFDPWLYEHANKEQLFLGLLRKIENEIEIPNRALTKIGLHFGAGAKTVFQVAADILLERVGTSWWKTKKAYKKSLKELSSNRIDQVDEVEKAHSELKGIIYEALKKKSVDYLVLFVDDLDRCLPDRAILLLDQLKNFMTLPGTPVVTVIGIDETVFAKMLNANYQFENQNDSFGHSYLEKIVQKAYRIKGRRLIGGILNIYVPYSWWLIQEPHALVNRLSSIWMMFNKKFNARKLHRAARNLISLTNKPDFQRISQIISELKPYNTSGTFVSFRQKIQNDFSISLKKDLEDVTVVALCVWILLIFRIVVGTPNPQEIEADERKTYNETSQREGLPPLAVLQEVYEKTIQWI